MASITTANDPSLASSDEVEARVAKAKELGYLQPPSIEGRLREFALNDYVAPYKKPNSQASHLEAAEHRETARGLDLYDIHGRKFPSDEPLITVDPKGDNVKLTFSDIIALAGDFYTNREGWHDYFPIADAYNFGISDNTASKKTPTERFKCAVDSLITNVDGYLKNVQKLLNSEHEVVEHTIEDGESVARAYKDKKKYDDDEHKQHCAIPTDADFVKNSWALIPMASGEDAVMAYCVGHTCALNLARKARDEANDNKKMETLRLAYIYEAFAAHYLTDLFSSGHLRPCRRAIHTRQNNVLALAGIRDVPIWDTNCRFMHDDDSATGLYVRNKKGDCWIEYGDKQFFEPQAIVNRARWKSAAEVYLVGYDSFKVIGDWVQNQDWFEAMELIPQPMTAVLPQKWLESWGGYDMHNPAPLWMAPKAEMDIEQGWTVRKDINDHSNFGTRSPGSLANVGWDAWPKATPECQAIMNAPFRGSDQFPVQSAIKNLLSGGLIQIQDLNAGNQEKGTCINFWSSVKVKILDKTHTTYTIRNRLIDEDIRPNPKGPTLHWMRGTMGSNADITGFSWMSQSGGRGDIVTKTTGFTSNDWQVANNGAQVELDMGRSYGMRSQMSSLTATILSDMPSYNSSNLTRFVKGYFVAKPLEYSGLDTLALAQIKDEGLRVGIISPALEESHAVQHRVDNIIPGAPYGAVKAFRGAGAARDSILLARGKPNKGIVSIDLAKMDFDGANKPALVKWAFEFKAENITQDASILVGDALGLGYSQVVVMALSSEKANIAVYGSPSHQDTDIKPAGTLKCSLDQSMKLTRPILTALIPTCTSNRGFDILQITRHQSGKDIFLRFNTYCRTEAQPGVPADEAKPYTKPKEVSVRDNLASQSSKHYFSIKWMPVQHADESGARFRGVLEIFSWYGVLGARLFGAGRSGYNYEPAGQLPHLGQTSIGAGVGSYGDWGHGFISWNEDDEWIDVNLFNPVDKKDLTVGSWGMKWEDLQRPHIRGWDVENRPLR